MILTFASAQINRNPHRVESINAYECDRLLRISRHDKHFDVRYHDNFQNACDTLKESEKQHCQLHPLLFEETEPVIQVTWIASRIILNRRQTE
jgi:hypothetical protein